MLHCCSVQILATLHDVVEHLLHGGSHGGGALDGQTHHAVLFGLNGVDLTAAVQLRQQSIRGMMEMPRFA